MAGGKTVEELPLCTKPRLAIRRLLKLKQHKILIVLLPLLVAKCNFINALNLLSPVCIFCSEESFVLEDMKNKAVGICKSNGNVLNSALPSVCVHLTEADRD